MFGAGKIGGVACLLVFGISIGVVVTSHFFAGETSDHSNRDPARASNQPYRSYLDGNRRDTERTASRTRGKPIPVSTPQSHQACTSAGSDRSLQYYRQLPAQEWRRLNDWQRERGLSQTRLRADGELTQEPSIYIYYDIATLNQLAIDDDADAQYWLAMKYRESGQARAGRGDQTEDAHLVIVRLLTMAATRGHVQAMLAISNEFYQQMIAASDSSHQPRDAYPDLQIKTRAWQRVAAWRMGRLPDEHEALPAVQEQQASQLATQLIEEIQHQREQQGLPAFDNIVPPVVIGLLQQIIHARC